MFYYEKSNQMEKKQTKNKAKKIGSISFLIKKNASVFIELI